jgi:hypothetical protein
MAFDKMPATAAPNDLAFALIVAMLSKEPRQLQLLLLSPVLSPKISKDKNRLLKVCYVPATSASHPRLFLLRPLTVLMKQTRQAVHAINQSILLRCL